MEAGAAFLLLVIVIVLAIAGVAVWAIVSTLRRRKLNPSEDKIDSQLLSEHGPATPNGVAAQQPHGASGEEERPEHTEVSSEQRSRSMPRHE